MQEWKKMTDMSMVSAGDMQKISMEPDGSISAHTAIKFSKYMESTNYSTIEILNQIKMRMKLGAISYDQAKDFAEPFITTLNSEMKEKSKTLGKKHTPFTFSKFMR